MKGALSSTALTLHISSKGLQSKGLPAISYSASPCLHKCKLLFLSFLTAATCIMRCAMAIGFTFRVTSAPPWTRFSFHTSLRARSCQSQDAMARAPARQQPSSRRRSRGSICRACRSLTSRSGSACQAVALAGGIGMDAGGCPSSSTCCSEALQEGQ